MIDFVMGNEVEVVDIIFDYVKNVVEFKVSFFFLLWWYIDGGCVDI